LPYEKQTLQAIRVVFTGNPSLIESVKNVGNSIGGQISIILCECRTDLA
jgi:hypothetical protein